MNQPENNTKRLILFENAFLEKLTVISARWFIVCWAILLPLIGLAGWGAVSPLAGLGLIVLGLLGWSLFEYAAHRYLFHWETESSPTKQIVFVIHGNHHVQPRDLLRNLMPPIVSVPVGLVIWVLLYAIVGSAGTWILLGFMTGYAAYDLTHYACHQWPMRSRLGRLLKRHHMRHHFTDNEGNFAITAVFWDRVFGSRIESVRRRTDGRRDRADHLMEPAE